MIHPFPILRMKTFLLYQYVQVIFHLQSFIFYGVISENMIFNIVFMHERAWNNAKLRISSKTKDVIILPIMNEIPHLPS